MLGTVYHLSPFVNGDPCLQTGSPFINGDQFTLIPVYHKSPFINGDYTFPNQALYLAHARANGINADGNDVGGNREVSHD